MPILCQGSCLTVDCSLLRQGFNGLFFASLPEWVYRSVVLTEECPRRSLTVIRSTPFSTSRLAKVCLRSWNLKPSMPALLHALLNAFFTSLNQTAQYVSCRKIEPELPFFFLRLDSLESSVSLMGIVLMLPLFVFLTLISLFIRGDQLSFSPSSLFLASSTSGRPGSASLPEVLYGFAYYHSKFIFFNKALNPGSEENGKHSLRYHSIGWQVRERSFKLKSGI